MDAVVPLLIFVPLLSLLGGITLAILRTVGRQKQIELLQRERIAALERGLDPAQLPTLGALGLEPAGSAGGEAGQLSRNLMVAGIVSLALGIGLMVVFAVAEEHGEAWTLGIVPQALGIGLLVAAAAVRPRGRPAA